MEAIRERIRMEEEMKLRKEQGNTGVTDEYLAVPKEDVQKESTQKEKTHKVLKYTSYALSIIGVISIIFGLYTIFRRPSEYNTIVGGFLFITGSQFLLIGAIGNCLHDIRQIMINKIK